MLAGSIENRNYLTTIKVSFSLGFLPAFDLMEEQEQQMNNKCSISRFNCKYFPME